MFGGFATGDLSAAAVRVLLCAVVGLVSHGLWRCDLAEEFKQLRFPVYTVLTV